MVFLHKKHNILVVLITYHSSQSGIGRWDALVTKLCLTMWLLG